MNLSHSLACCRHITRRASSSFPLAFLVLPSAQRDAMNALYAYFRLTDDIADGPGDPASKRLALKDWRTRLHAALNGEYTHDIHPALHHAVTTFHIPTEPLEEVIAGAEADLEPVRYATFAELEPYCIKVASTVGVACVHVWGFRSPAAVTLAEPAGIAFQLTNILRDLGEDLARGRVYLPADELQRFDCPPESWRDPAAAERFRAMMRFQTDRANEYYRRAEPLFEHLSPEGRAVFGVMMGVYRRLLAEIERQNFDVFTHRIRVSRFTKARLLLAAWGTRWRLL